jgi:hypothetical protein
MPAAAPVAPLSDVALPPAGIRFIGCTGGAGALAPGGGAVEGVGCAQLGAEIAIVATTATPVNRCCFIAYSSKSENEGTL